MIYANPSTSSAVTRFVRGTPVTVVRPNNAVAYAAGQVFGTATDGRFALTTPAMPADAIAPTFIGVLLVHIQSRGATDSNVGFNFYLFAALPATVLADQIAFALSDADIALLQPSATAGARTITPSNVAAQQTLLNNGAGVNGRRAVQDTAYAQPGPQGVGLAFAPSSTLGGYLVATAAYTPVALEQWTVFPYWQYTVEPIF